MCTYPAQTKLLAWHNTILIPHRIDQNIYVRELGRAYSRLGMNVVYGPENLVHSMVPARTIHVHWPEEFYAWGADGDLAEHGRHFLEVLDSYKASGSRIIWTVHNLSPHERSRGSIDHDVYQGVVDRAQVIAHHCPASIELLAKRYHVPKSTVHVVAPHGHYDAYPSGASPASSRKDLGIPADALVFLHFGQVRPYKGLQQLLAAFKRVRIRNKWLVIAGRYETATGRTDLKEWIWLAWYKHVANSITLRLRPIPSQEIQVYMSAADALVLSHSTGLNSGVAVLGMTFGKLVIGPRLGCIEWVLNSGTNIMYEPNNLNALADAMQRAACFDLHEAARKNMEAAHTWDWQLVASRILDGLREFPY